MPIATKSSKIDITQEKDTKSISQKLSKDQADYIGVDTKGPFKSDSYRY